MELILSSDEKTHLVSIKKTLLFRNKSFVFWKKLSFPETKFSFLETKFSFPETKFRFLKQNFCFKKRNFRFKKQYFVSWSKTFVLWFEFPNPSCCCTLTVGDFYIFSIWHVIVRYISMFLMDCDVETSNEQKLCGMLFSCRRSTLRLHSSAWYSFVF